MDEMKRAELEAVLQRSWETRERCTVTSLKALDVERVLGGFVPQTWADVHDCLRAEAGGPGCWELDVNPVPHVEEDGPYRHTPTGRKRTVSFARFVREHPSGLYVFGNYRHCCSLVDGFLVDTEKGQRGSEPGRGGERHVKVAFQLWDDETRRQWERRPQ